MDRAPHYLRVVQALALVSGFGPVAIVVGATVSCCSSTGPICTGFCLPPETPTDAAGQPGDGQGGGIIGPDEDAANGDAGEVGTDATLLADADSEASLEGDAAFVADGSTDAASDGSADATTDGGPSLRPISLHRRWSTSGAPR
jgi:hypothetical protein